MKTVAAFPSQHAAITTDPRAQIPRPILEPFSISGRHSRVVDVLREAVQVELLVKTVGPLRKASPRPQVEDHGTKTANILVDLVHCSPFALRKLFELVVEGPLKRYSEKPSTPRESFHMGTVHKPRLSRKKANGK